MSSESLKPDAGPEVRHAHSGERKPVKHVLMTLVVVALLGAFVAGGLVLSGLFNIAATEADSKPLTWVLVTTREASIGLHARDITGAPPIEPIRRNNGFRIYRAECAMCHTPIGRKPTAMALGFNPQAPGFGKDADNMTPAQLFWVTKNGIRFTGMPAWKPSRSDTEIWDVVAFVMTLPKMSAADYDAMDRRVTAMTKVQP